MIRVSSNLTLPLKIFIPTFWFVFFGLFGIAILVAAPNSQPLIANSLFRLIYFSFFILFTFLFYYTFLQLKRVDYNEEAFFVSNYFQTYKYGFGSIKEIKENDYWVFKIVNIVLKGPGKFGKIIRFIPSKAAYNSFIEYYMINNP